MTIISGKIHLPPELPNTCFSVSVSLFSSEWNKIKFKTERKYYSSISSCGFLEKWCYTVYVYWLVITFHYESLFLAANYNMSVFPFLVSLSLKYDISLEQPLNVFMMYQVSQENTKIHICLEMQLSYRFSFRLSAWVLSVVSLYK